MNYTSIGDMALTFQNNRQNVQIKSNLARLSQELASGQVSNLSTAVAGDFLPIIGLERSLRANAAYSTSTAEAALFATAMQASLEMIQENSSELGPALLAASSSEQTMLVDVTTADARTKFEAIVSAFNTRVADRYAFSGAATDRPPLADAETMLASLQTAIAAETTAAGIETVVDAWFDDVGGGFETVGYTGSNNIMSPFRLSDSVSATVDLTAFDPRVRSVLKGFAIAALLGEGALSGDGPERTALTRAAGENVINAEATLAGIRAEVGTGEALIESAAARNAAERLSLEIARSEITAVDPYRAATELEAVQLQLETMYKLTVRLSRLSLSEYLR